MLQRGQKQPHCSMWRLIVCRLMLSFDTKFTTSMAGSADAKTGTGRSTIIAAGLPGWLNCGALEGGGAMKAHFCRMAEYNAWANARLYAAARSLPDASYRRNVGAFFGSLHGTLNHLMVTDRIWMRRLTGVGEHPEKLNAILFDELGSLERARREEDARILTILGIPEPQPLDLLAMYRDKAAPRP
jgi:hypothetical protein